MIHGGGPETGLARKNEDREPLTGLFSSSAEGLIAFYGIDNCSLYREYLVFRLNISREAMRCRCLPRRSGRHLWWFGYNEFVRGEGASTCRWFQPGGWAITLCTISNAYGDGPQSRLRLKVNSYSSWAILVPDAGDSDTQVQLPVVGSLLRGAEPARAGGQVAHHVPNLVHSSMARRGQ